MKVTPYIIFQKGVQRMHTLLIVNDNITSHGSGARFIISDLLSNMISDLE